MHVYHVNINIWTKNLRITLMSLLWSNFFQYVFFDLNDIIKKRV